MRQGAQLFAHLKQLLKMHTRQRDKAMMLSVIEEVSKEVVASLLHLSANIAPARHPPTIPRSLHHLLRASYPRLQIRQCL